MTTFTHSATFDTVMGDIKLGKNGGWGHPPVLQVQFQGIVGRDVGFAGEKCGAELHALSLQPIGLS